MKRIVMVLGCLGLILASSLAAAQSIEELKRKCVVVGAMFTARGYRLAHIESGNLNHGEYDVYQSTMYSGNDYVHIVAAANSARDVDIWILDERKNLISQDTKSDNTPIAENSPRWTGDFYEVIKMHSGNGQYVYMRFFK